jgi:hypothetical protein
MQGNISRKGSIDSHSTQDPEILDSGLYCDFARRSTLESVGKGNLEYPSTNVDNNNISEDGRKEETGLRKFGIFHKFASLRGELTESRSSRSWGRSSSNMSSHHNNTGQTGSMESEASGTATIKVKGNKPRGPRRGSHCMMPPGGKMPTSAELIAMKQQQTAPVATAPPAEPTAAAAAKPRRRRGSDFMPEGGGKMPTSAELMAQKQQGQVPQDAMAHAAPTMKM